MVSISDLRQHLEDLRARYFQATPEQRFRVALSRLEAPANLATALVDLVSAVEAFARSIALDSQRKKGADPQIAYDQLRWVGAVPLLRDHVASIVGQPPEDLFGADDWTLFVLAVDFRNLLVHEAATVREGYCVHLVDGCRRVLDRLAQVANVRGAG